MCLPMRAPVRLTLAAAVALGTLTVGAADPPRDAKGHIGLALMLRKLATVGTVMVATAHPDDEHNPLISRLAHGEGLRVVVATATRGDGGQNEIGPELFEPLGVLRTEELLVAHRFDGAEQLFTRAVDFGYSVSVEESYEKWGRDDIVSDYTRLIRRTRPDVIVTMRPSGPGGGQHHQASARLAAEAFTAAADPARFPEHLSSEGPPWRAARLYQIARYGFGNEPQPPPDRRLATIETDTYDAVLGHTFAEIGSEARAMHKSQGFGQLLALPGSFAVTLARADDEAANDPATTLSKPHEGLDLSLEGMARRFAGPQPPSALVTSLKEITRHIQAATSRLTAAGPSGAVDPLLAGLRGVRELRQQLATMSVSEPGRFELDFRLRQTEAKFTDALVLGQGLRIEAFADDGVVTPGQPVKVIVLVANRGSGIIEWRQLRLDGFGPSTSTCPGGVAQPRELLRCEVDLQIPNDARTTEPYWRRIGARGRYEFEPDAPFGLPFRPTPFLARLAFAVGGTPFTVTLPVQHRYEGNIFSGEKRMELHVVPAVTARVSPEIVIVPAGSARAAARDVRVSVTSNSAEATTATVTLSLPHGWTAEPSSQEVKFSRADEAVTARFMLRPASSAKVGKYEVKALVDSSGRVFDRGFQVIEYPHTPRRHIFQPSATVVQVVDVSVPEDLKVGYVMGVGDQVPPAIEQIGARIEMLGGDVLAWGDLSRFDAIVTGVRAYERRADLRAYNHRLLQYAEQGGTVIVQYNKFEFNQAQYGPFPAKVSSTRVTDENSPVVILDPKHPAFSFPNRITDNAWKGWAQERGLYFLGERDPRYTDLLELVEPFEFNAGPKRGALVEARVGRGRWIYVGLGLWRQVPAGTEGAYRLLANLISLGRAAPTDRTQR
jgi:LmbE family N-acetylglucosaminyl deacetylase